MPAAEPGLLANEAALGHQLRVLFNMEAYDAFQALLEQAIDNLPALDAPGESHLRFLLHFAERACLEDRHIAALLAATRGRCREMPALRLAWGAVAARRRFRQHIAATRAAPFMLVPLGLHCLPWTLGNRWGLRSPAQFADTLNPFCLAVHKPEGVIAALEADFAGYAAPETIRLTTTPRGHRIAMRADATAVWNHNKGEAWLGEDFAPLVAGLARKAEAFRRSARAEGAVFLLANAGIADADEPIPFLAALRDALAQATGRRDARLIITAQPRRGAADELWLDRDTALLIRPYPARDYVWADDDTADSTAGLGFERGYATGLLRCLRRWGFLRSEAAAA